MADDASGIDDVRFANVHHVIRPLHHSQIANTPKIDLAFSCRLVVQATCPRMKRKQELGAPGLSTGSKSLVRRGA